MTDDLDTLRHLGETLHPCSGVSSSDSKERLSLFRRLKIKIKYIRIRKPICNFILGKPLYSGILMEVDLSRKTKVEVDAFWRAIKELRNAGIYFDTGMGCNFDMELDWSLKGARTICKRCGYNSENNRINLDNKKAREHFVRDCDKCEKLLDSNNGYWHVKKHFWNKAKYYHTDCHTGEKK